MLCTSIFQSFNILSFNLLFYCFFLNNSLYIPDFCLHSSIVVIYYKHNNSSLVICCIEIFFYLDKLKFKYLDFVIYHWFFYLLLLYNTDFTRYLDVTISNKHYPRAMAIVNILYRMLIKYIVYNKSGLKQSRLSEYVSFSYIIISNAQMLPIRIYDKLCAHMFCKVNIYFLNITLC